MVGGGHGWYREEKSGKNEYGIDPSGCKNGIVSR
jgi:hypothetical protein